MSDIAYVTQLPDCDIHKSLLDKPGVPAAYDGKTVQGPWANMCEECFGTHGVGLGTGRGQRLIVGEKPAPTKPIHEMTYDEIEDLVGDGDIADYL